MKDPLIGEHFIYYKEQKIKFQLIKTPRRKKTIEIKILYGDVIIKSPLSKSIVEIEQLIKRNADWILKAVKKNKGIKPTIVKSTYKDGSSLPYLGKNFNVKIIRDNSDFTNFTGTEFVIHCCKFNAKKNYEDWLFAQAYTIFSSIIQKHSQILKVEPRKIIIKKLKSRWGSATSNNIINLNLFLIKSPIDIIEYVVLHELCHLSIKNHPKEFWALVGFHLPDYKDKILWLKINGSLLL